MTLPSDLEDSLSPGAKSFLDDHLAMVRRRIIEKAHLLSGDSIEVMDVADSAKIFAPGTPVDSTGKWTVFRRLMEPISGLTIVCTLLTALFGLMGLWASLPGGSSTGSYLISDAVKSTDASSWLDVAKVFAGAIVGSTGAGIVTSVRGQIARAS